MTTPNPYAGHTPEPWTASIAKSDWDGMSFTITGPNGEDLAVSHESTNCGSSGTGIWTTNDSNATEADVRLMADAPKLLRQRDALLVACSELVALWEAEGGNLLKSDSPSIVRAREAIKECEQ